MAESPSGLFPDFHFDWSLTSSDDYVNEIETARSGREQRRLARGLRRRWLATGEPLSIANRKVMRDFLISKTGRFAAFYFWSAEVESLAAYAVGSVSAATTITAPIKGSWWRGDNPVTAGYTAVYVAGVSKPFTAAANVGANGEDQITFTGGAQTGAVTVDAPSARLLITARSDADSIMRKLMVSADSRTVFSIAIQELI